MGLYLYSETWSIAWNRTSEWCVGIQSTAVMVLKATQSRVEFNFGDSEQLYAVNSRTWFSREVLN